MVVCLCVSCVKDWRKFRWDPEGKLYRKIYSENNIQVLLINSLACNDVIILLGERWTVFQEVKIPGFINH